MKSKLIYNTIWLLKQLEYPLMTTIRIINWMTVEEE